MNVNGWDIEDDLWITCNGVRIVSLPAVMEVVLVRHTPPTPYSHHPTRRLHMSALGVLSVKRGGAAQNTAIDMLRQVVRDFEDATPCGCLERWPEHDDGHSIRKHDREQCMGYPPCGGCYGCIASQLSYYAARDAEDQANAINKAVPINPDNLPNAGQLNEMLKGEGL